MAMFDADAELDRLVKAALAHFPAGVANSIAPLDLCLFQAQQALMRVKSPTIDPRMALGEVGVWVAVAMQVYARMDKERQERMNQPPPPEAAPEPVVEEEPVVEPVAPEPDPDASFRADIEQAILEEERRSQLHKQELRRMLDELEPNAAA